MGKIPKSIQIKNSFKKVEEMENIEMTYNGQEIQKYFDGLLQQMFYIFPCEKNPKH